MKNRPKVIVKCVADRYAGPNERIIEFSAKTGEGRYLGGLVAFRCVGDTLRISLYRLDKNVIVNRCAKDAIR